MQNMTGGMDSGIDEEITQRDLAFGKSLKQEFRYA